MGRLAGRGSSVLLFTLLFTSLPVGQASAGAGGLDPSFGGDGKVTTNFTSNDDLAFAMAVQGDQKIVAAGLALSRGGSFALARYDADGTLDTTFGGDGKVTTNFTSGFDAAFGMGLQADGKIVGAGRAGGSGGRFALARYNTDGSLDTTFGGDGKVTTNFAGGNDFAWDVAVQADQRIVAAGFDGAGGRFALARYNTDGTLDTTFGGDGKVTTNFSAAGDIATGLAIQSDAKIVAVGAASDDDVLAMARYNADGTLDTGFSGDGKLTTNFTSGPDFGWDLAIQGDGKIVTVGRAGGRFGVGRYNTDGTLDTTFGGDGKVTTNFTASFDVATAVAIQADGKIVAAGGARGDELFALARYNTDGTLDTTFGGDGKVTTNFTPGTDLAWDVAMQADGKIVVAGRAGGSGGRFALARYLVS